MAQYKSFAPQGSFSDFQMTAPDQSAKIEREAARQLRGMQAAQAFTEKNQAIIGQAMRQAQAAEKQQRDQNFKRNLEYRRAYRAAEERNYQTEIENDANAAKSQQQAFKDLSAFSETAFKLYSTIDQTVKKAELGVKHKLALDAGLDLEDLDSLRGIESKLDRSQFNQLAFIQQKIKEGASPTQISALYEVFKRSGSNQWYEMKSLYQNSVLGHDAALRAHVETMFEDGATPSDAQIKASIEAFNARYIETKLAGARPEILESSGVYTKIRNNTNTLISSFSKQAAKEREEQVKQAKITSLNTKFFENRDTTAVVAELQANPSADNRKDLLGWATQGVLSGNITVDEARAILNGKIKVGNNDTTIAQQYNGFPEVTELAEAIEVRRKRDNAIVTENLRNDKLQANAAAVQRLNDKLEQNGGLSEEDIEAEIEYLLQNGGDQSALAPFLHFSNDAQASRLVDDQWEDRFEKTGALPTLEEINNLTKLDATTRNKWVQLLNARKQIQPKLNEHEQAIRNQVKAAPEIQALGSAAASGTVAILQTRMVQEFRQLLRTTDPDAARAIIIEKIQKLQAEPGTFDKNGNYFSIMQELTTDAARGKVDLQNYTDALKIILKQPRDRRDFKALSTALGANTVFANIDNINAGRPTTAVFNRTAEALGLSPYELADTLSKANNITEVKPAIPEWDKLVQQSTATKRGTRLRNTYREVVERTHRANVLDNGRGGSAPVRSSFSAGGATFSGPVPEGHRNAVVAVAEQLGVSPIDLAAVMSLETGGTFAKDIQGGEGGNYKGLIQFGIPERAAYGYRDGMSFEEQMTGPVFRYLKDRGVRPGHTVQEIYAAILTGNVANISKGGLDWKDSFGTSVRGALPSLTSGGHYQNALRFLNQ